jgi:cytochrome c
MFSEKGARRMSPSTRSAVLALALAMASPVAAGPTPGDLAAGHRLAEEYCGMCHALDGGGSPLPNAPPFRDLYRRYPPGGLSAVLKEGMLAPSSPQEEGSPRRHPRMPVAPLGDDQRAELQAFLQSLDDAARPKLHTPP